MTFDNILFIIISYTYQLNATGGPISKLTYQQVSKLGDLDKSIS
jgi:hypothetical protein